LTAVIDHIVVKAFRTVTRWSDAAGHRHPSEPRPAQQDVLCITDSDGATGYCLMRGDHLRESVVAAHLRPALIGEDPMDRERLWRRMAHRQRAGGGGLSDRGLGYADQALWDLVGRKLETPVWKLIGGAREVVPAYASTMCGDETAGGLGSPEDYASFAKDLVAQGYKAIKLHTWLPPVSFAPDVDMDIKACAAVREAVGPDIELMLDPNHWYSRLEALKLGRALERLQYYWLEEPMEEASIQSYRWLAEQLDIPVLGPETAAGKHFTRAEWLMSGACDILRIGVNDAGGITPALKTIHLAEAFNVDCEVHGSGSGNIAVIGGTFAGRWYERALLHPHFDYDDVPPHLKSNIDPMDEDGNIHMPMLPGLGDDLDLDYIEGNLIATW
jgi:L-alanine-DL-glutamate epimerase-like enolase superfamily enzyme